MRRCCGARNSRGRFSGLRSKSTRDSDRACWSRPTICLGHELTLRGIPFARQVPLSLTYKGLRLHCAYRLDYVIDQEVVIELKSVDVLLPIHEIQLATYLRIGGFRIGLLINFNAQRLKDGIVRGSL